MAYKVFTNGSTLQASELNENLMQQSIAVFSNAAARTAAITSPVEGQMTYLQDTNQYASWNGSAWVPAALGVGSGLVKIVSQTIGTAVSSVTVTNAFSSAYNNYKIVINGATATADNYLYMRLGASNTGYYDSLIYKPYASALGAASNSNASLFSYPGSTYNGQGVLFNVDLFDPFLTKYTVINTSAAFRAAEGTGHYGGVHQVASSFTDFTITTAAGTITGGTISVYGYSKE